MIQSFGLRLRNKYLNQSNSYILTPQRLDHLGELTDDGLESLVERMQINGAYNSTYLWHTFILLIKHGLINYYIINIQDVFKLCNDTLFLLRLK